MSQPRKYGIKLPCGHADAKYNISKHGECYSCQRATRERAKRLEFPKPAKPKDTFVCGHPRTPENSSCEKNPQCKICRRVQQTSRYTKFRCGHDVSPSNIKQAGRWRRCLTCHLKREQDREERRSIRATRPPTPRKPRLVVETPAAVLLYRQERSLRAERLKGDLLADAKRAYRAILARESERVKGGRPKSQRPQIAAHKTDPLDLHPYIGAFFGSQSRSA